VSERRERASFRLKPSLVRRAVIEAAHRDEYLYQLVERAIERELGQPAEPPRKRRAKQPA